MSYVYVRDSKGFPIACACILRHQDSTFVGMSIYRPGDKFDKSLARKVACGRAQAMAEGRFPDFADTLYNPIEPGTSYVADVYQAILNSDLASDLPARVVQAMEAYLGG